MAEQAKYEESELYKIRHSVAHVMAQAVMEMFPEAKYTIGPPIENGFYYDFDLPRPLTPEDLKKIQKRTRKILNGKHEFVKEVLSADEAREIFKDQPYKLELIAGLEEGGVDEYGEKLEGDVEISTYTHDTFVDLCRGPHVENTSDINPKAVKLMSVAGAYWRGDEKNPMLQRIYGTAWKTKEDLDTYLWRLEEAKKRDHRKLGKELDLFSISEEVGPGLILWHPKGAMIRVLVEDFARQAHLENGYDWVFSPHIGRAHLWETSGHLGFYEENMYAPIQIEDEQYFVKPMNCPFHIEIYKKHLRSYRDLPMRYAENGTVYRYERRGVLHGLTRVRGFTQDDAHIFCRSDQVEDEISRALDFSLYILRAMGLTDFKAYLSTMPEKHVGEPEDWSLAVESLRRAVEKAELPYDVDEGGGAFYGPKIDLKVNDALGREWQLSTIQFDFNLPERFEMEYIGEDGQPHRPYMVHRALLGSMERFFGVLIEHFGGAFPVWLSPVQAVIIPITDSHFDYAFEVKKQLKDVGIRVEVADGSERMNAKIRNAQKQKVPYMLVVGDKEMDAGEVALRMRDGENPGAMPLEEFIAFAKQQIADRA
ncbi:MAG: threonine--tRNA ligase [Anaerolineaceae bacterium 4572_5.1]|nr:MAG: threonine--tRNA ligase [Anaerolineaceae bacterium 4572_5.1]